MKNFTLLIGMLFFSFLCYGQWTPLGNWDYLTGEKNRALFGNDIDLSADGSIIAVGSPTPYSHPPQSNEYGTAQVFKYIAGEWVQIGSDIRGNNERDGRLGIAISLSANGNILAVGETRYSISGIEWNLPSQNIGRVRVFQYNTTLRDWEQIGEDLEGDKGGFPVTANTVPTSGNFGIALSLSADGNRLIVGDPSHKGDTNNINKGQVKVYENNNGSWVQLGNNLDGDNPSDFFGSAVAISGDGNIIAIGSAGTNSTTPLRGRVKLYRYENNTWVQIGNSLEGQQAYEGFGSNPNTLSLNYNGEIVALGAAYDVDNDGWKDGKVSVYENINDQWALKGNEILADNYIGLGAAVDLTADGTALVASAPLTEWGVGDFRVYTFENNTWSLVNSIMPNPFTPGGFGSSVAISNDASIVSIGAPSAKVNNLNSAGRVAVYQDCNKINISLSTENNPIICQNEKIELPAIINEDLYVANGIINWFNDSITTEPFFTGTAFTTPRLTANTSYWVEAVSPTGCPSERIEVNITVNPVPQLNVQNTVIDVCNGAKATLYATTDIGTLQWYKNLEDSQPIATGNTFNSPALTQDTTYWVEAISDENCNSERIAIDVFVNDNIQPNIVFNYNNSYCPDGTKAMPTLEQDFYPGGAFSAKNGIVIDPITGEIDVENSTPGNYSITYTVEEDLEACITAKKHTQEVVIRPCFVQRGISPNGDGINDNFDLRGIQAQKVNIFNRYGTEVYSFNGNYTNQWDGKDNNGKQLPDATYFYTIFTKNGEKLTGWVYINKQF